MCVLFLLFSILGCGSYVYAVTNVFKNKKEKKKYGKYIKKLDSSIIPHFQLLLLLQVTESLKKKKKPN